jgi:hypothetical protein
VDFIEKMSTLFDGFAARRVGDGGKVTNSGREGTGVDEFGVARGRGDMFLVPETAATKDAMEFQRIKGCAGFGCGGRSVRRNRRECSRIRMDGTEETMGERETGGCYELFIGDFESISRFRCRVPDGCVGGNGRLMDGSSHPNAFRHWNRVVHGEMSCMASSWRNIVAWFAVIDSNIGL